MPFLLPAIGPAVGTLLGGILGRNAGEPNNYQKQSYNLLNSNAQNAAGFGQNFGNTGMNFLNQARSTLAAPTNYFQQLLSGNSAATSQALAPDINRIQQQNQGVLQSTNSLAPRGAGRGGTLFNLPFQNAANVSGLFNQVRPQAAQGLTGIGGLLGQLGLGSGGLGANFLNSGNYAGGLMGSMGNQIYNQQHQAGQGFGGILGGLLGGGGGGGGLGGFLGSIPSLIRSRGLNDTSSPGMWG